MELICRAGKIFGILQSSLAAELLAMEWTSKTEVEKTIKVLREQQEDITHAKEVIMNMIKATSASERS